MKVYISGRISNNEKHYKEDFNWVEEQLKGLKDIDFLKECDAILLIKGDYPLHKSTNWKKSYGAKIEKLVAQKYGLKIFNGWREFASWYRKQHKYDINSEVK